MAVSLISLLLIVGTLLPAVARASVWSVLVGSIRGNFAQADTVSTTGNVQTMPLLQPAMNIDPTPNRGGGDITIVDDSALVPEENPGGTLSKPKNSTISTYVVREGDTLSEIAELFEVKPSTILWANDLPRNASLRVGQTLTILPVTGVKHTVRVGDTIASIAKKYSGDAAEIANFNGLDGTSLAIGTEIIIPDGEIAAPVAAPVKKASTIGKIVRTVTNSIGYYAAPLGSYIKTQGIHGYNGVDLAAPVGTPILASAGGAVMVAKNGGYNGGYGSYAVIQHENGSQTLYSHASRISVSVGDNVVKGEVIGNVGSTGKSTGPHLHFEIRNGVRNPF